MDGTTPTPIGPRPKPLVGVLLGLVLGLIIAALLCVLGMVPPDRLPLFGILSICVGMVGALLTQRLNAARGRAISMIVIASLLGGVALTGIPEAVSGGSLSDGCTFVATTDDGATEVTPGDTAMLDPLVVGRDDTVQWAGTTEAPVSGGDGSLAVVVGGFTIPIWNGEATFNAESGAWSGTVDVAQELAEFQDSTGFPLGGVMHVSMEISTDAGTCSGDGYVLVEPEGPFNGYVAAGLWALLVVVLIAIAVVAVGVRRSMTLGDEDQRRREEASRPTDSVGTGSTAAATVSAGPVIDDPAAHAGLEQPKPVPAADPSPSATAEADQATASDPTKPEGENAAPAEVEDEYSDAEDTDSDDSYNDEDPTT